MRNDSPQRVRAVVFTSQSDARGLGAHEKDTSGCCRDRALFDLAIDSKPCGCDVVKVRIGDLVSGGQIRTRAIVIQQKTGRPMQFELNDDARVSLLAWLERWGGIVNICVREPNGSHHARQHARLVDE